MNGARIHVGTLVVDERDPPTAHAVRMVVGYTESGQCLTSYVDPPPWMTALPQFYVSDPESLTAAPAELVGRLPGPAPGPAPEPPARAPGAGSLGELERVAGRELVVGREADYCAWVNRVFPEVRRAWRQRSRTERGVREQIMREAPEFAARLSALDALGEELTGTLERLWATARRLEVDGIEPGGEAVRGLRRELLDWCEAVRLLERTHTRALQEAYYRDVGCPA